MCVTPPPAIQVLETMPDKPGLDLEQQPSWTELAVLVRMLLYLSFQDRLNGEACPTALPAAKPVTECT